jgi:hypothetical protein
MLCVRLAWITPLELTTSPLDLRSPCYRTLLLSTVEEQASKQSHYLTSTSTNKPRSQLTYTYKTNPPLTYPPSPRLTLPPRNPPLTPQVLTSQMRSCKRHRQYHPPPPLPRDTREIRTKLPRAAIALLSGMGTARTDFPGANPPLPGDARRELRATHPRLPGNGTVSAGSSAASPRVLCFGAGGEGGCWL